MPLKRRAAPRAEIMGWDGSAWQRILVDSATYPNLRVRVFHGGTGTTVFSAGGDSRDNVNNPFLTESWLMGFNGSTWDRWRNNINITVLPSATRTASGFSSTQTNYNARGVLIYISITAVSGTFATGEGLFLWVAARDPVTGGFRTIMPAIGPYTTTTNVQILIYPGATDISAQIEGENDVPLPREWRLSYSITGTTPSFTFSAGASYIV